MAVLIGEAPPKGAFVDKGLFSASGIPAPTGSSATVTLAFGGEAAGGGVGVVGVITTAPFNLVRLLDQKKDELVHTASGSKVYGRLTFGGGVWTIGYYFIDNTGTEQAVANIATDTVLGAGLTDIQMAGVPKVFGALDPALPILEHTPILETSWAIDYVLSQIQGLKITTSPTVDFKVVGTTNLYTVPVGKTLVIVGIVLRCTNAVAISADAFAGVGIAAGEDDIFLPETLVNFRTSGKAWVFASAGLTRVCPTGSVIKLGVDTGATGTTLQGVADILGYLI